MTDEELIARLRKFPNGRFEHTGAADRIEALVKEKAAAYAQGYGDCEAETSLTEIGRTNEFLHGQIAKWKARLDAVKDKAEAHIIDLMAERDRAEARAALDGAVRALVEAAEELLDGYGASFIDQKTYEAVTREAEAALSVFRGIGGEHDR